MQRNITLQCLVVKGTHLDHVATLSRTPGKHDSLKAFSMICNPFFGKLQRTRSVDNAKVL